MTNDPSDKPQTPVPIPVPNPPPTSLAPESPTERAEGSAGPGRWASWRAAIVRQRVMILVVSTAVLAVACVLLALMVFAPGIAPFTVGSAGGTGPSGEIEELATRFTESLYTFDYRTIDADLDRIDADATGGFQQELQQVLGDVDVYRDAIIEAEAVSTGDVEAVDVRSIDGETATVRVFVTRTVENNSTEEPRRELGAVELVVVETADGWKVDDVQQFTAR